MWDVVQDLYSTDLTQEKGMLDHADYAAPTRQHGLDHAADQEYIYPAWHLPCLADLGHEVGVDVPSNV